MPMKPASAPHESAGSNSASVRSDQREVADSREAWLTHGLCLGAVAVAFAGVGAEVLVDVAARAGVAAARRRRVAVYSDEAFMVNETARSNEREMRLLQPRHSFSKSAFDCATRPSMAPLASGTLAE